jgi:cytochrome P450
MQNPYPFYEEVRGRCPVGHSDRYDGFFFAVSYDAAKQVLSDFQSFSSTEGVALPKMASQLYPVDLDPPLQTKYRRVLNRFFTVEEAKRRSPDFKALIDLRIDAVIERGHADASKEITRPALNGIMLPLIGIPEGDQTRFTAAIDFMSNDRTGDETQFIEVNTYVFTSLVGFAAQRRAGSAKADDVLQLLIDVPIDGRLLDDVDVAKVLLVTLFGALDTTHATLSEALLHLSRTPADKARLGLGDVDWNLAIEEFVRFASPIQGLRRTVTRAMAFGGSQLEPGDPIFGMNGAANRDPAKFSDPDRCVLTRDAREHLGFGSGAHVCLGRHFAREIIRITLSTLLERMPDFAVPKDFTPEYTSGEGRRMKSLPITFTRGAKRSA